jgi:hypothetical protein
MRLKADSPIASSFASGCFASLHPPPSHALNLATEPAKNSDALA